MAGEDFDIHAWLAAEAAAAMDTPAPEKVSSDSDSTKSPSFFSLVWPENTLIPDAWMKQTIEFKEDKSGMIGIIQPKNGPCGVLSCIQAVLIANRMIAEKQCSIGKPFTDEEISVALAKIIKGCAQDREDRMCDLFLWKEKPDVAQEHVKIDHVEDFMRKHISQYKGEGGIILLIYAAVATRRPDVVRQDITAGLGGPSLIEPGTWFCNTDIISLLLRGVANGDIGEPEDGPVKDFDVHTGVGLLSIEEYNGIPIAEVLKSPKLPVWILHNGSHFTTLFDERGQNQDLLTPPTTLFHWNGLPPEGPRMMKLKVKAKTVSKGKKNAYFKPLPGEIEDVVGPKSEDKKRRPKQWKSWSYEVILAIDDPTVQGAERPPDLPVHIFDLGEEPTADWRCASCYRERYATFFFGANESTDEVCTKCKKTKVEAGWSIWLPYESLPIEWQRKKDRQYDKLLGILRTKWPDCEILSRE